MGNMDTTQRRQPQLDKDIFGNEYLGTKKVFRFILDPDQLADGPGKFLMAVTTMNVPHPEITRAISDALLTVGDDFWQSKIEALTPFEWKLSQALEDMEFRQKVAALLEEAPLPRKARPQATGQSL